MRSKALNRKGIAIYIALIIVFISLFYLLRPTIIGYISLRQEHIVNIEQEFVVSKNLSLEIKDIEYFSLNGYISKGFLGRVYLNDGMKRYKVVDYSYPDLDVTVENSSIEFYLQIEEFGSEVVRLTVNASIVNDNYVCTEWSINDANYCLGSSSCCEFLEMSVETDTWSELIINKGKYNALDRNLVRVQVWYTNYSVDPLNPYSDIKYSNIIGKIIDLFDTLSFSECGEACSIEPSDSYNLQVIVNSGSIYLDNYSYKKFTPVNSPPAFNVIPNVSMALEYSLDLSQYVSDSDGDLLSFSYYDVGGINITFKGNIAMIVALDNFTGKVYTYLIANDSKDIGFSNIFEISVGGQDLRQGKAKVGEPVKWIKKVKGLETELEHAPINFSVKKSGVKLDENKIKVRQKGKLIEKKNYKYMKDVAVSIVLEAAADEVVYYTAAPFKKEEKIKRGKRVTVSSDVHYTDITAFAEIDDVSLEKIKLYHVVNDSRKEVGFTGYDTNNNSLIDYIEWIVPSLSSQTYEIILITKAEHLDENRSYMADIYDYVKAKDNNWSEVIYDNEYVRVMFQIPLDNTRDITIYARSNQSAMIEIYTENNDSLITKFEDVSNENWYTIYLTNLTGSHDVFDLRTIGNNVEYDYIVDPQANVSGNVTQCGTLDAPGVYTMNQSIENNTLTGPCINITAENVTLDCAGYYIKSDDSVAGIYSNQYNTTIKGCNISMSIAPNGYGIYLVGANSSHVINNTLIDSNRGIFLNITLNSDISNNTFSGNYKSIYLYKSNYNNITNNSIENGELAWNIGILVQASNNRIVDNTIKGVDYAIYLNGAQNNSIIDNYLENCKYSGSPTKACVLFVNSDSNLYSGGIINQSVSNLIRLENSDNNNFSDLSLYNATNCDVNLTTTSVNNIFLNVSYNISKECINSSSQLIRKWYYRAYVNDTLGNNVRANVSIYNVSGVLQKSMMSSASTGYTATYKIIEYVNDGGTVVYYSNYTINATNSSYITGTHNYNITIKQNMMKDVFTLNYASGMFYWPSESMTSSYVINGSVNYTLNNNTRYFIDQYINFTHVTYGKRLQLYGLFSQQNVDLTNLLINASSKKTVVDVSSVSGIGSNHTLFLPNYHGAAVYICPNAEKLSDINTSCPNIINVIPSDFGTWKSGVRVSIEGSNYKIENLTGSGVGEDATPPEVEFKEPTPADSSFTRNDWIFINVSVNDSSNVSTFIDFDNSLIAWWRFDDVNSSGDPQDYMGRNNGTAEGNAVQTDAGYFGKGFGFDGNGDYIALTETASLESTADSNQITVAMWINPDEITSIARDYLIYTEQVIMRLQTNNDLETYLYDDSGGTNNLNADNIWTTKEWQHIALTFDNVNMTIYRNGISVAATNTYSGQGIGKDQVVCDSFNIGEHCTNGVNEYFNGTIDDVIIFNRSLSAEEISALYADTSLKYFTYNFTSLADGPHTFKAYAQDRAGNVNSTETRTVTVDTIKPWIILNYPDNYYVTPNGTINFSWTAADNLDTSLSCNLTINGTVNESDIYVNSGVLYNQSVAGFNNGTYYWNVTCWDNSGNVNTSETRSFTIDTITPSVTLNKPLNGIWQNSQQAIFNYTVIGTNLDSCILYGDFSGNWQANKTNSVLTSGIPVIVNLSLANGRYIWNVKCNNTAGTEVWAINQTLGIDTIFPEINFTAPMPANNSQLNVTYVFANVTANDSNNISVFIDFDNTLILWMRMDDVNQTGEKAIVYDNSGYGNNGTAFGNAVQTDAGFFGKGFDFDGEGDYIKINSFKGNTAKEGTVSFWIYYNVSRNSNGFVTANNAEILIYDNNGNISLRIENTSNDAAVDVTLAGEIPLNKWTHYAFTWNKTNAIIYVNGSYAAEDSSVFPAYKALTGAAVWIGSDRNIIDRFINGTIDDVLIFNRSLGTKEILALYANTSSKYLMYNFSGLSYGNHTFKAYAQDRAGNINSTETRTVIILDITLPVVILHNPINGYNTTDTSINFNWTATDNYDINLTCNLTIGGVVNATGINSTNGSATNYSVTGFNDGLYNWNITCWDSSYNVNSPETWSFRIDTTPPTWSNNKTYPVSVATYAQDYQFNVTWIDSGVGLDTVLIEHNFTGTLQNITITTAVGNEYYYDYSDLAVGTYVWRSYANDSLDNINYTDQWIYIVDKASSEINLTLNNNDDNITIEAGDSVSIEGRITTPTSGYIELYENGSLINYGQSPLSNNTQYTVPGVYNITAVYNATQNYSAGYETHFIIVNDSTAPNISIILPLNYSIVGWTVLSRASVTDYNLDSVWYEIRNGTIDDPVIDSGSMNDLGGNVYNGTLYSNATWPYNVSELNSTNLTLVVYANDTTGNVANSSSYWVLDNTRPSIQYIEPLKSGGFYKDNFSLDIFLANTKLNYSEYNITNISLSLMQTNASNLSVSTFSWRDLVNVTGLADGNYTITTYARDYIGNNRSEQAWFYVDKTVPDISDWKEPTPPNNRYTNVQTQTFNFTCNDSFINIVWIEMNAERNDSLGNDGIIYWWTRVLNEGSYTYTGYCNDSVGNMNYTETRTLIVDLTAPAWSNNRTYPMPATYSAGQNFQFNITWSDNYIENVFIEHNFTGTLENVSMNNVSNEYYFNISDLAAGTYVWRSYANDSAGNINVTDQWIYVVGKASTTVNLTLNNNESDITLVYPQNLTAVFWTDILTATMYRNGTDVSNENDTAITLAVGYYNYTVVNDGNENYSSSRKTYFVTVEQNISSCSLSFEPGSPINYGTELNVSCSCTNPKASAILWRNRTNVTSEIYQNVTLAAGSYEYVCNVSNTGNYSNASMSAGYLVTKLDHTIHLAINSTENNASYVYPASINATGWLEISQETSSAILYRNSSTVDTGSPASELIELSAGYYNYTYYYPASQNYTGQILTRFLQINRSETTLTLNVDPSWTVANETATNVSCYADNSEVNISLWRNYTLMNSSVAGTVYDYQTLNVGDYNYTCNTTGSQNYTAAVESDILIVTAKNMSNCSLSFEPGSGGIYPVSVNASCSCTNPQGAAALWRNGTNVSSENNIYVELGAGDYYYVCNVSETQGYASAENSSVYTINKRAAIVNLTLNSAEDNLTLTYPQTLTAIYSTNNLTAAMYRNGTDVSSENDTAITLAVGYYNYTVVNDGNENYSASRKTFFVTVLGNSSICSLAFNPLSPITYGTALNASCSCDNPEASADLWRNNTNVTGEIDVNITLAAGDYLYVCNVTGSQNYTSAENSSNYTINKAASEVNLLLNGTDANYTVEAGNNVNISASLINPNSGYIELYLNYSIINSGQSPIDNETMFIGIGDYNITAIYNETENYTAGYETHFVTVEDTIAPNVTLNYPENNDNITAAIATFNCSATDASLANITLYGNWSGWLANETKNLTGTSNSTAFIKTLPDGDYKWNCLAYDQAGNSNFSASNWTFSLDTTYSNWTNLSLPGGIYYIEPAALPEAGNFKYNFTIVFENLTASEGEIIGCYINQSNCYDSGLSGCKRIFVNKTITSKINGENMSISYILGNDDIVNTTLGGTTSIWIPWRIDRCGAYHGDLSAEYEESISWRIHVHSINWTGADIANAVNAKSLKNQFFLNTIKADNLGDVAFAVAKYNGAKVELVCNDGIDDPDDPDSAIDCADADCRGITFSCLAKQEFDNSSSYYSPSGSHGTLASEIPPGDMGYNSTSGTTFNTGISYTMHTMPNGTFKIRFRRWNLSGAGMLATIIAEGFPPIESVNKYAPGTTADDGLLKYFLDKTDTPRETDSLNQSETYGNKFVIKSFDNEQKIDNIDTIVNMSFNGSDMNMSEGYIITLTFNYVDEDTNIYEEKKNITIYFDDPGYNASPQDNRSRWNSTNERENEIWINETNWGACNDTKNSDFDMLNCIGNEQYCFEQSSYDCYDLDCNLAQGTSAWNAYASTWSTGICGYYNESQTAAMCFDGYNNDWATEDNTRGHINTNLSLIDCRDNDCNNASNGTVSCQYNIELNCSDSFDNDMYQRWDCNWTNGSTYNNKEYDCAAYCRENVDDNETGTECDDGIDNDWDLFYRTDWSAGAGANNYSYNTSFGAGIDCGWNTSYPDEDCNLTIMGSGYRCELAHELTCNDTFDNDYDNGQGEPDPGWTETAYNAYFNVTYNISYSAGADYDDYDCQNDVWAPINESINASWCFDGIDNDLDGYYWTGSWTQNSSTGTDCADPDCLAVSNPANENETCLNYEYNASDSFFDSLSEIDLYCKNSADDDADNSSGWPNGGIDCTDPDCNKQFGMCYACSSTENITWDACADETDNDYDQPTSLIDCDDQDCTGYLGDYDHHICAAADSENSTYLCTDGFDNDGDSLIDCADSNCNGVGNCEATEASCDDDLDNDRDGSIDCADSNCYNEVMCNATTDLNGTYMPPTTSSGTFGGASITWDSRVRVNDNYTIYMVYSSDYDTASLFIGNLNGDGINKNTGLSAENFSAAGPNATVFETQAYSNTSTKGQIALYDDSDHVGTDYDGFNITIVIPTSDTLTYDSFEYSHSISGSTTSGNTLDIIILDNVTPVIEAVLTEPGNKNAIEYNSSIWVGVLATDQENGEPYDGTIDRCYYNVTGPNGYVVSTSYDDSDCRFTFSNLIDDGSYNLTVWARDDTGNIGNVNITQYTIDLKPKYVSGSFSLSDRWYETSDTISISAQFDSDDAGIITNCSVYYKNSTGPAIFADNISASNSGDRVTCSGSISAPNNDEIYELWINITDAEGDNIKAASETFYVCNNENSSGLGSNGEKWSCIYRDMDSNAVPDICRTALDRTAPNITLNNPEDNYNSSSPDVEFNWTALDDVSVSITCNLTIDGNVNQADIPVTNGTPYNLTVNNLDDGVHYWNATCWDAANNVNTSSTRYFNVDTIGPWWSNNKTSPVSPAAYSAAQNYQFNITWSDNYGLDIVLIEHNFTDSLTNDSMDNVSNEYYFNVTDLAAGTYIWRSYANNTRGNANLTDQWNYIVGKAIAVLTLSVNPGWTVSNETATNVSCYADNSEVNISLWRNYTLMNSGVGGTVYDYQTLDVGDYNYTCNTTGSQNYTAAVESDILIVTTKNISDCSLSFEPGSGGIYPVSVNASCSCTNPQSAAALWRNGTNVSSENNIYVELGAGDYYYVCNVSETQDYISAENSSVYTINKRAAIVNLTLNGVEDNLTLTYPQTLTAIYSTNNLSAAMYRNGTDVSSENDTAITLAVGYYNYTVVNDGNENYSSNRKTFFVTILKNSSICSLAFNPLSPITYGAALNASCSCDNPEASASLYRNGTNVTGEIHVNITLAAGYYLYVCNVTGSQNYTFATVNNTLNISRAASEVNLTLDGTDDNITIEVNSYVEINATLVTPTVGSIQLYNNGSLINSGATPLSNNTLFGIVGLYNITAEFSRNENYSYDYETHFVTVIGSVAPVSPQRSTGGGGRMAFKSQCEGIDCGETVKACGKGIVASCQNLCAGGFCSDCTPECPKNLCEGIVCDQITRECSSGSVVSCNPKCSEGICGTCAPVCIDPCEGKICPDSTEKCLDETVAMCSNACENGSCTNCTPVCLEKELDLPAGVKFALNLFYILLISSIPIIASYVGISLWKKGYWRELLRRRPNELDRYITSELQKGFEHDRIRNILIKYGWSKGRIDKAFRNIYRKDYEACLGKLQTYIKKHLKSGIPKEQIKRKILANGWQKQIIGEIFKKLK